MRTAPPGKARAPPRAPAPSGGAAAAALRAPRTARSPQSRDYPSVAPTPLSPGPAIAAGGGRSGIRGLPSILAPGAHRESPRARWRIARRDSSSGPRHRPAASQTTPGPYRPKERRLPYDRRVKVTWNGQDDKRNSTGARDRRNRPPAPGQAHAPAHPSPACRSIPSSLARAPHWRYSPPRGSSPSLSPGPRRGR